LVSGLPRLQPCEISALKIGNDFVGDSAVNVQFLAHAAPPFTLAMMRRASSSHVISSSVKGRPRPPLAHRKDGHVTMLTILTTLIILSRKIPKVANQNLV
jgi:hypothetical protein